jgi:hypothetical protein
VCTRCGVQAAGRCVVDGQARCAGCSSVGRADRWDARLPRDIQPPANSIVDPRLVAQVWNEPFGLQCVEHRYAHVLSNAERVCLVLPPPLFDQGELANETGDARRDAVTALACTWTPRTRVSFEHEKLQQLANLAEYRKRGAAAVAVFAHMTAEEIVGAVVAHARASRKATRRKSSWLHTVEEIDIAGLIVDSDGRWSVRHSEPPGDGAAKFATGRSWLQSLPAPTSEDLRARIERHFDRYLPVPTL